MPIRISPAWSDNEDNYQGYSWIKTWEDRYNELEKRHVDETTFLIEAVRELARKLAISGAEAAELAARHGTR